MNLQELRAWLEKQLRVAELPEVIWEQLVEDRMARNNLSDIEFAELELDARRLLKIYRAGSADETSRRTSLGRVATGYDRQEALIEVELGEYENERTRALAEILARYVGKNEEIADFRQERLNERLLTPEEAHEFLDKPSPELDALRSLVPKWARLYGWEEDDMSWTILTGQAPELRPLDIAVRYNVVRPARITITAEQWVPAKVIERNYRKAQQRLLGKDNHPLSLRSLATLRFVEADKRSESKWPGWRKLMERWNLEFPEWSCKDVRNFQRTYDRALEEVAHPSVGVIGRKLSPDEQRRKQYRIQESKAAQQRMISKLEKLGEKIGKDVPLIEVPPPRGDG